MNARGPARGAQSRNGAKLGRSTQGGFVTSIIAGDCHVKAPQSCAAQDTSVQAEADRASQCVPDFVTEADARFGREFYRTMPGALVEHAC